MEVPEVPEPRVFIGVENGVAEMAYRLFIDFVPEFKPGDPPPSGYMEWHEWARVQTKAGLKSKRCGLCLLWNFPQEMSDKTVSGKVQDSRGRSRTVTSPVCLTCAAPKQQTDCHHTSTKEMKHRDDQTAA